MKLTKILAIIALYALFLSAMSCFAENDTPPQSDSQQQESIEDFLSEESLSESFSYSEEGSSNIENSQPDNESEDESASLSQSDSASQSSAIPEEQSESTSDSESESASVQESEDESLSVSESEEESFSEEEREPIDEIYTMRTDGKFVAIDIQNKISSNTGRMSFITKTKYKGIKRIAFNARSGNTASWWGIAIASDKGQASLYNTDLIVGRVATGGYWVTFIYEFSDTGCIIYSTHGGYEARQLTELAQVPYSESGEYYIYFVGPLSETFSEPVCIDNFTVELFDGSRYVDTFDESKNGGLFNADRAVSHQTDETYTEEFITVPETDLYETDEVYYLSDDQIDFTAYAPVTVENWGGSWTSNPNLVTDEQYRYMAEAGFTKSLGLYEGRAGDTGLTSNQKVEKDSLAVLAVAEKYGIKYYALNERFYNFVRPDINIDFFDLTLSNGKYYNNSGEEVTAFYSYLYLKPNWKELYRVKLAEMFNQDTQYIDSVVYGGNFAVDEPALPELIDGEWYYGELEQIYYQLSIYNKYMSLNSKYGGEAYVNLLPYGYVYNETRERYDAMLDYYFKNLAPLLGYVCYDHYPLMDSGMAYISQTHLLNLEIMANYCKQYGVELRSFVWAKTESTGHRALICANDLRLQIYANLAFGAKEIPYYTYFNYYAPGENGGNSLIDCQTGKRTKAYYWAKEVNNEVHSLEKAFLNFKWEGTTYFDEGPQSPQLSILETSLSSHHRLKNIYAETDVLVGLFSDEDGKNGATDGFMVLNYADPFYAASGETKNVVLTFDDATHALVYKDGKQYLAELTDGVLSLYLEAGEGVFVVPFNK